MKATLSDGTIIEGTYDEIQQMMSGKKIKDIPIVPKIEKVPKLVTELLNMKKPSYATAFSRDSNAVYRTAKKLGMTILVVKGKGKAKGKVLLPLHEKQIQKPITDASKVKRSYSKIGDNSLKLQAILERDGFLLSSRIKDVMGYVQSNHNTIKSMKSAGNDVFNLKRVGIYKEGFKEELINAKRLKHVKRGFVKNEYNDFTKRRVPQLAKQGIYAPEAFRIVSNEWSALKNARSKEIPSEIIKTEESPSKESLYAPILGDINGFGLLHFNKNTLDSIGSCARDMKKVGWDYRNFYLSETEWTGKILPVFLRYARNLEKAWNVKHLKVENGELIVEGV